jgi:hypothetical protein
VFPSFIVVFIRRQHNNNNNNNRSTSAVSAAAAAFRPNARPSVASLVLLFLSAPKFFRGSFIAQTHWIESAADIDFNCESDDKEVER